LEFTHEYFEDLRDFTPVGQEALARVFTDAITILNIIGWDPGRASGEPVDIPLTAGYIEQLHRRRVDLAQTNADRLDGLPVDEKIGEDLLAEITTDRLAAQTVDDVIAAYTRVISA
jgi:hypothetical protein